MPQQNRRLSTSRFGAVAALCLTALVALACGEADPETVLQDASDELAAARTELGAADEGVEEIRGEIRALEEELADAERVRREAAKHVKEAEAQLAEVADDDTLFRSVQRRLLEDAELAEAAVSAVVANGVVTLKGVVDSQEAVDRAVDVAQSAPGVASVISELRIPSATPADAPPAN